MFKGYKLDKIDFDGSLDHYKEIGQRIFILQKSEVEKTLNDFFLSDNSLDAVKIVNSWFPGIKAHAFISHSHKDEDEVIALAGWLYKNFNIISFIDSCVWGYGNDLIQILDNQYSWLDKTQRIYHYNKVLYSASHVHMMLSTALNTMIDNTECLIFYDTPNSIQSFENKDKTESPWIYSEIAFSETVRMKYPKRLKVPIFESREFSAGGKLDTLEKSLKVKYDISTKHLKEINADHLIRWYNSGNYTNAEDALDKFYEITFPLKI